MKYFDLNQTLSSRTAAIFCYPVKVCVKLFRSWIETVSANEFLLLLAENTRIRCKSPKKICLLIA